MTRAATFPEVVCCDAGNSSLGEYGRVVVRHGVLALGAVAAVGGSAAIVTVAAAWIVAAALSTHSNLHAKAPMGLATIVPVNAHQARIDTARLAASYALELARAAELRSVAAAASAPAGAAPPARDRITERADRVTAPPPGRLDAPLGPAKREVARASADRAAPHVAAIAPPPPVPAALKPPASQQAHNRSISLPDRGSRTAVYDIEAHTVYLPGGDRLEAHSGIGRRMDDPHYAGEKNRGPTPPNVYDLVMREEPFHGVRAIRLNPVDDGKMFGRDGMLAHTYMLGPTGQSFGCVSFKDYPAFLRAFLKGEVGRLVVVPHLGNTDTPAVISRRRHSHRYASN